VGGNLGREAVREGGREAGWEAGGRRCGRRGRRLGGIRGRVGGGGRDEDEDEVAAEDYVIFLIFICPSCAEGHERAGVSTECYVFKGFRR